LQDEDLQEAQRCFDDLEKEKIEMEGLVERLGQELARYEEMENKAPDERLAGQIGQERSATLLGDEMTSRNSNSNSSFYNM
jgi:hypothetical protein